MEISKAPLVQVPENLNQDKALKEAAAALEASFLAEMLKAAGLGESRSEFGGGSGEDQFSSFLVQAQAEEMVKTGGIGLAEAIFNALKERQDDT
jgi:Rod binding domain-containing protein